MVRAYGVDFLDLLAEGDGLVDDELDEFVWRGLPGKELELLVDGASPRDNDEESNLGTQEVGSRPISWIRREETYDHGTERVEV